MLIGPGGSIGSAPSGFPDVQIPLGDFLAFDSVSISFDIDTSVDAALSGGAGGTVTNATLVTVGLNGGSVSVGSASAGFSGSITGLAIAFVFDNAGRKWIAAKGTVSAAFAVAGLSINTGALTLELNGTASDGTAIDFTQVNTDQAGGADLVTVAGLTFLASTALQRGSATGAAVDLFGLLEGSANFAFSRQKVDVDLDGDTGTSGDSIDDARLFTFALDALNLSVGSASAGLHIGSSGRLGLAVVSAPGDTRVWTAVTSSGLLVSLSLPGLSASITGGAVEINRASGPGGTQALNWATAAGAPLTVDLDPTGGFTTPTALVDPGATFEPAVPLPISYRGSRLVVSGQLIGLNLFDFITGSAGFAVTRELVDVDLDGDQNAATGEQLNDAGLVTFALSSLDLAVGIDGVGLTVSGGNLGIAVVTAPTGTRTWTAVSATGVSVAFDVPGITGSVTGVTLKFNRASGDGASAINWTTAVDLDEAGGFGTPGSVDPGAPLLLAGLTITETSAGLDLSGSLTSLNLFDFLTGSAGFTVTRRLVDVNLGGELIDNAGLLTFGLSSINLRIGLAGAGFTVTGGNLGIAVLNAPLQSNDDRSWTAIVASGFTLGMTVPGITASLSDFSVQVGRSAGLKDNIPAAPLNWTTAIDLDPVSGFGSAGTVVAGTLPINVTGSAMRLAGTLTDLNAFDFITGSASFAVSRLLVDADLGGEQLDGASLLTFALSNLNLSVGVSGAGLAVTGGNLGIAMLTDPAGARSWTALSANSLAVAFALPGISGSVTNAAVKVGRGPSALNWTTAIDTDPEDGFDGADVVDPGAALPTPVDLSITQNGSSLVLSGTVNSLNVFDFITGSASFAVTRQLVDVQVSGTETLDDAGLLTVALSNLNLHVGIAGVGLTVSSGNIGIAVINGPGTDTRSWTALSANSIGVAVALPGITAAVTGAQLKVGRGPTELDWTTAVDLDPADGFGTAGSVDPGAALDPAVDLDITQNGTGLSLSGSLNSLNLFDFITGSADFAVTRQLVDVKVSETETLDNAGLLTIGLRSLTLSVGVSGIGFTVTGGSIGIAVINAPGTDARSWTALSANTLTVNLALPGITASVSGATLKVGRGPTELDWTTAVDLDPAGGFGTAGSVNPGAALTPAVAIPITQNGSALLLSGTLSSLNLFDFITGGAGFAVTRRLVDVDLDGDDGTTADQLDDAGLMTIALSSLSLSVGISGVGLTVTGGNLGIAVLNGPGTDTRSWTAVSANGIGVTVDLPGIDATVSGVTLEVGSGPTELNWNTAIDDDPADGFDGADVVDPGSVLPTPVDLSITQVGSDLLLSGSLTDLNIFDFITGSADFAVTRRKVDARISATEDLDDAGLLTIGLSDLDLAIGVSGIGLTISEGNIGIAILNAPGTDTRSWTALSANGIDVDLELPGISASVSGLTLNGRPGPERPQLEHGDRPRRGGRLRTASLVDPGATLDPAVDLDITQNGTSLLLSGTLTGLNIFDFITGSAGFAITRQLVDVDLNGDEAGGEQLDDAGLLTIGLSSLNLSVGVSGVGFTVSGGNIGIAVLTEPVAVGTRSWTAVSANSLDIALALPGITASVSDLVFNVGQSSPTGTGPLDWATSIDLDADDGFGTAGTVDPGATLSPAVDLSITQDGDGLQISGSLTNLNVFNFITGSADFAVTRQLVDVKVSPTETLDNAGLLTIALSDLSLDIGISGVGLTVTGGNIGIATINESLGTRSWTALSANSITVALALPGIAATVTGAQLRVGRGPTELDWATSVDLDFADGFDTAGTVDPGALISATGLAITQKGNALLLSGVLSNLNIFDFITGSASFAVTRQLVDVDLDGDGDAATGVAQQLNDAGLLTVALSSLNLNVGVSGVGLTVTGGNIGIAVINDAGTDTRSWTALSANGIGVALALPGISATVSGVTLKVGDGATALDWTKAVDTDSAGGWTAGRHGGSRRTAPEPGEPRDHPGRQFAAAERRADRPEHLRLHHRARRTSPSPGSSSTSTSTATRTTRRVSSSTTPAC